MPTIPLTEAQRVDARRFAGYPAFGTGSSAFGNWRFFQSSGLLEFRLTNISDQEATVLFGYLADCTALDAAIVTSGANLDTDSASVWTHNKNETKDRTALFNQRRRDIATFLGVPPGPGLSGGGVRIVV